MSSSPSSFPEVPYLSLATFRKSGAAVATAVWFAEDAGTLYVFSAGGAGKIKRLRNSARAQVAVCDVRGKLLGDWQDASARILVDAAETTRALQALRRKYGLQMWLADTGARLTGRFARRAYIGVTLDPAHAGSHPV